MYKPHLYEAFLYAKKCAFFGMAVAGQRQLNSEEGSMPASDKGLCLPRLYIATPIRRMQKSKALSRLV
jgi:hypothetical protein